MMRVRINFEKTNWFYLNRCWGRFLTSVKGNGQAREQLFSKWISDRLIDTVKETLIGF